MEKTEGKKTVIVIDEQGNKLESTYPKRAKGLIKNGRARVVDENTICLVNLPKHIILEDNKMNNNNINLEENKEVKIDQTYIINKIDEINKMNSDLINKQDFWKMACVPGSKTPVQCICETNNKMIDFLQEIYKSLQPKQESESNTQIINGLTNALITAIDEEADQSVIAHIADTLAKYIEK